MYIPKYANQEDRDLILDFMDEYPFATIITPQNLCANHFPLLLERNGDGEMLVGHMAKANSQWRELVDKQQVLAIFQGPHSYISPSIYVNKLNVPTWNYTAVHAYGKATVTHDATKIEEILFKTINRFEGMRKTPWKYDLPKDFRNQLVHAIVGFEIRIEKIEAKFKLSQNRSSEDYQAVFREFSLCEDANGMALFKYMKLTQPGRGT